MRSDLTDEELLARAAREPQAFGRIYERHAAPVLAYLLRRTGSPEVAADLTAEVFAAALQAATRFSPDGAPVRAWLFTIANNKLADSRRRGRTEDRARRKLGMRDLHFVDDELREVEERLDVARQSRGLWALVDDLSEDQRAAVMGRIVDGRDYADLASEFGVREETVRQRVSRALVRLARDMREENA